MLFHNYKLVQPLTLNTANLISHKSTYQKLAIIIYQSEPKARLSYN